ncbi:MAG: hypothetical protein DRH37_03755 [Deltaproteobacteria bacterium]|nr:MAG: hypothetical protein DRH37_03755 [Deltaproteobacteria bacterium]
MVEKLLNIQHRLNPLHIYCRFMDCGINRKLSAAICRSYEMIIFHWVNMVIKTLVHLMCMATRRDIRIDEAVRKF